MDVAECQVRVPGPRCLQITVGSGFVGHALLTDLLLDTLKTSAPARVVVVTGSLEGQGVVDWDDIGCAPPPLIAMLGGFHWQKPWFVKRDALGLKLSVG